MKYIILLNNPIDHISTVIGKSNDWNEAVKIMKENFAEKFNEWYDIFILNNPLDMRGFFQHGNEDSLTMEDKLSMCKEEEAILDLETGLAHLGHPNGALNGRNLEWVILDASCNDIRTEPMNLKEIFENMDAEGYIFGNVLVAVSELVDNDLDGILDLLSERLVGTPLLQNINYTVVDAHEESIVLHVTGYVQDALGSMMNDEWDNMKSQLFRCGTEALEDFLAVELGQCYDKDAVDHLLDEIYDQMPEGELIKFYKKYY